MLSSFNHDTWFFKFLIVKDNCQDTRILVGGSPYNGLKAEALLERGTVFRLPICERIGISQVEVYGRVVKSVV